MNWLRIVFDNFWWKLLALGIAVALWAIVANEPELSTFATVRVAYKNVPDDLEISEIDPMGAITLDRETIGISDLKALEGFLRALEHES